jgi:DNA-binding transcriptional MerR regulator
VLCERAHWLLPREQESPLSTPPAEEQLTVDQLAARVGMTVRNVRAYAARGLLPPPRLVGRTGFYGRQHVARLQLVRQMLTEGWSLSVIERTLASAPATASTTTLALHRALVAPWLLPEPEETTAEALAERAGLPVDHGLVDELVAFGLVERVDDERLQVLDPALLTAGLAVVELGVEPRALLAAQARVVEHVRDIARTYVQMFVENAGETLVGDVSVEDVGGAVARLQSAAAQALLASFRTEMAQAVQDAVREQLADVDAAEPSAGEHSGAA